MSTSTFRELDADQTKRRKVITSRQFDRLVEVFAESDTPSIELRDLLGAVSFSSICFVSPLNLASSFCSQELGMSNREVQVRSRCIAHDRLV